MGPPQQRKTENPKLCVILRIENYYFSFYHIFFVYNSKINGNTEHYHQYQQRRSWNLSKILCGGRIQIVAIIRAGGCYNGTRCGCAERCHGDVICHCRVSVSGPHHWPEIPRIFSKFSENFPGKFSPRRGGVSQFNLERSWIIVSHENISVTHKRCLRSLIKIHLWPWKFSEKFIENWWKFRVTYRLYSVDLGCLRNYRYRIHRRRSLSGLRQNLCWSESNP